MSSTLDVESLAARLEKLERQSRRLRAALLTALVLPTAAFVMGGQAETKPGPVKATGIGLSDLDGKPRPQP
jgi:hypothetical protein